MLISVVLPSYNHARYIEAAVRSVLDQTYRALELIIIDDGSSDSSVEILRGIKDTRVRLFTQQNRGAHEALNRGLSLAQGDYLAILNSDDLFHPERLSKCLRFLDEQGADLVSSWIEVIDQNGAGKGVKQGWNNMRPRWASQSGQPGFWNIDHFALNLLSTNFVSTTSNILFRRNVFETVGGMRNLRFAHDWDFLLRVSAQHPCAILPEALLSYRVHDRNTINTNRKWMLFEICWVLAANLDAFEGTILFGPDSPIKEAGESVRLTANSINVMGCDRMFNVLRTFIASRQKLAGSAGPEDLLHDSVLRQQFIDLIEDEA